MDQVRQTGATQQTNMTTTNTGLPLETDIKSVVSSVRQKKRVKIGEQKPGI